jgi:hypothetical protein
MGRSIEQSLNRATSWILEQVTMVKVDEELSDPQRSAEPEAEAFLRFVGPVQGTLRVRICGGLLPTLSARMLGTNEPPETWMQLDALGEITNLICGGLLPMIAPEEVFSQTPPTVTPAREAQEVGETPTALARVGVERGRAEVRLYIDEAA